MRRAKCLCRGLIGLVLLNVYPWVAAQEPLGGAKPAYTQPADAQPADKEQIDAALKLTTAEAKKYRIVVAGDRAPAELKADPVLRWSNPATGVVHGNVFLWTKQERPVAVGSLFQWFSPHTHMSHEFHSLSESPLTGAYGEQEVWRVAEAGVKFVAVPEGPKVAATKSQRLLQMRQILRAFAATKRERDGSQAELRPLTQPIYRYAAEKQGIVDGGMFAFVQGTDPEVFVLLEARENGDDPVWQYGLVRMNGVGFSVSYRDREVWSMDVLPWRDIQSHRGPYTSFRFVAPPPASLSSP
jgi:hypothetical protein